MSEKIPHGYKLLMGTPAVTGGLARSLDSSNKASLDHEKLNPLLAEYRAVHGLLTNLAGSDNLKVLNSKINWGLPSVPKSDDRDFTTMTSDIQQVKSPVQWQSYYNHWPRDAHSYINGTMYAHPEAWKSEDLNRLPDNLPFERSELGEGGAVLTRKDVVMVGRETSWEAEGEIEELQTNGINLGVLPIVDSKHNVANHIDGFATLVEDKYNDIILLIAKSFYDQSSNATREIDHAVKKANTGLLVVDDNNFPPLAFNLIQFDDLTVAMTGGAEPLRNTLSSLVGQNAVHTTKIPIERIPRLGSGSIRCLTNVIPEIIFSETSSQKELITVK